MLDKKVVVIGSGIAGMTCAIYLKRAGIDVLVIESDAPGGQLNKASMIENYPGYKHIDGPTLAMNIYEQVNELNIQYLFDRVVEIKDNKTNKVVKTLKKEIQCEFVVLATGRSARTLNLENEKEYIGKGISYCALCDGNFYKNKDVIVVGGGNSALEDAIYLSGICNKVTIVHRKDRFTAEKILIDRIKAKDNVEIIYNSNVIKNNTEDNKFMSVTLDTDVEVKTDGVFIAIGYIPINDLIDIEKDNGYIIVNDDLETSINNIYACGDAIKKKTYQLATAVGEASSAASNIIRVIKNNWKKWKNMIILIHKVVTLPIIERRRYKWKKVI